ncbi:MAG TPA: FAD-binding oxidoreductase [Abditibacteriaceae bacterium]|jgi:FAD/FMN-containing dehydrogenase
MKSATKSFAGWGRYPTEECRAWRPDKARDVREIAAEYDVLARGLGRAYGDAALNPHGLVLTEKLNRFLSFEDGILECEGGASFADIIETFGPRGWFLPVTPGTKFVSVGGAIACDVHGKNHHRDGTIAHFLEEFDLLVASGELLHCSRTENAEAFWATIGGMGLTGIITRARLRLFSVESSAISAKFDRTQNLQETLEAFDADGGFQYSVAWLDLLASGDNLGRGVLIRGNHATQEEAKPLRVKSKKQKPVPIDFPDWALNPLSVRAFNTAYYATHPSGDKLVSWDEFFYPLDGVAGWNKIYGARGFVQYQCALPHESSRSGLRTLLEKLAESSRPSFLAVLKTFGESDDAPLSFPIAGHTLALDLPMNESTVEFARELDDIVLDCGGRVYLAKDTTLLPENLPKMYARLDEWRETKAKLDPNNKFQSSLSRRLKI